MKGQILKKIESELKRNADKKRKIGAENYFKEGIKLYGVRLPDTRKISAKYFQDVKDLGTKELMKVCESLLRTGYFENKIIAFNWTYRIRKKLDEKDFTILESWLKKYVKNWAECDDFSNHMLGYFIETYPSVIPRIKKWSSSKNRWVKRSSAVSFILPGRKGNNLKDILWIAKQLLEDEDDMVQKGYGWMLKETSKKNTKEIFNFVMKNKKKMPRTALRYAIEKMPDKMRKESMKK